LLHVADGRTAPDGIDERRNPGDATRPRSSRPMIVPRDPGSDSSAAPSAQRFFPDATWTVFVTGWLSLPAAGLLLFSFAMFVDSEHSILPFVPVAALAGILAF